MGMWPAWGRLTEGRAIKPRHLPEAYTDFRIETYRDRVDASGSYNKLGIVAREDDVDAILGHTPQSRPSRRSV